MGHWNKMIWNRETSWMEVLPFPFLSSSLQGVPHLLLPCWQGCLAWKCCESEVVIIEHINVSLNTWHVYTRWNERWVNSWSSFDGVTDLKPLCTLEWMVGESQPLPHLQHTPPGLPQIQPPQRDLYPPKRLELAKPSVSPLPCSLPHSWHIQDDNIFSCAQVESKCNLRQNSLLIDWLMDKYSLILSVVI